MPRAIVIRAAGTNCDLEMCRAFQAAGCEPELLHIERLVRNPAPLASASVIGFPGGFSYGDDIASGRIFAARLRRGLYPALRDAADRGACMIGACNGFQVLVQCGLLPGAQTGAWPEHAAPQELSLTRNTNARFEDRWTGIEVDDHTVCVWTRGLDIFKDRPETLMLPSAHGEGRLVASSDAVLDRLETAGQVALRYTDNFNGSARAIAGVCDPSGRILGLMPHPERYLSWLHHPYWTRLDCSVRRGDTPGLAMFRSAVEAASAAPV